MKDSPYFIEKGNIAESRVGKLIQLELAKKKSRTASNWIIAVGVLIVISGLIIFIIQKAAIADLGIDPAISYEQEDGSVVTPLKDPLRLRMADAVVQRRGAREQHRRRAEHGASDDVPGVTAKTGRYDQDYQPSEAEHQTQPVTECVSELLADAVEGQPRACPHPSGLLHSMS